jgi:hypothetical protein
MEEKRIISALRGAPNDSKQSPKSSLPRLEPQA